MFRKLECFRQKNEQFPAEVEERRQSSRIAPVMATAARGTDRWPRNCGGQLGQLACWLSINQIKDTACVQKMGLNFNLPAIRILVDIEYKLLQSRGVK